MPRPSFSNGVFNPELCPLLKGLEAQEQRRRMQTDPIIRACIRAIDSGGEQPPQCKAAARAEPRRRIASCA